MVSKHSFMSGCFHRRTLSPPPYTETRDIPSKVNKSDSGKQMEVSQMEKTELIAI